ncbi:MAG: carbamoyl phosphate synthase, partial [Cyanobacteria bacterium REEB65]|nr:carbamoyl phosphate synthase [Cyanobacteria bacterium REEB65]
MSPIQKVLIANRGEIAMRVLRACRELGLRTVAVFTEADRRARHGLEADESYLIDHYLAMDEIVAVACQAGAHAVHPGYGFLAENAPFARACQAAGLVWIGPHPEAIAQMGSKTEARRVAKAAGLPIVPGTTEGVTDPAVAVAFGNAVGWPIAVKAAAGGGGRGFAVANGPSDVADALARASREGERYFASGEVYLEKYLPEPRHIEVQVLADKHGHALHFGERECSVQRRHQKLIEECPSPAIDAATRADMGAAALRLCQAVQYDSAGTVEFLFSQGRFYFLEMNTRIQVEHPVSETITGIDLVQEQFRIARGEKLRFSQGD